MLVENATKTSCFAHFWQGPQSLAPATQTTSEPPKVVRTWCVLYILTSKNVLRATTACTFSTSQLPKVVRTWCVLYIFTSKCASRHNGAHFFDISTSKSAPRPRCFVHFDFEMCFAPQCRALFQHLNFQKCSEPLSNLTRFTSKCASRHNGVHFFDISTSKSAPNPSVFNTFTSKCASRHNGVHFFNISTSTSAPNPSVFNTFYFQICFAPQRRALFLTSQLPKAVRRWGVLYLFTSKSASRHNGVQLFISHLASWLRTRRFSEPTFRPSGATNHWKNTVFRDFPTFSRTCIFFLLIFSLLTLLPADCFFISPYCRKFDF